MNIPRDVLVRTAAEEAGKCLAQGDTQGAHSWSFQSRAHASWVWWSRTAMKLILVVAVLGYAYLATRT